MADVVTGKLDAGEAAKGLPAEAEEMQPAEDELLEDVGAIDEEAIV